MGFRAQRAAAVHPAAVELEGAARGGEQETAAEDETHSRRDGAGDAAAPPRIDAHEGQHEPVGQREPHGADLVVTGSAGIDDAAGDIQVRFGIAIVEQRAAVEEKRHGAGAHEGEREAAGE